MKWLILLTFFLLIFSGCATIKLAQELTSLEDCQNFDSSEKDSCFKKVAESNGDKTICDNIETDFLRTVCYGDVAVKTGDVSICEMFEQNQGPTHSDTVLCYKNVARTNNDESLCVKVKDPIVSEDCYANFRTGSEPDTNEIFGIEALCGDNSAQLRITLKEDVTPREVRFYFEGNGGRGFDVTDSFTVGQTREFTIDYSQYDIQFQPETFRIGFTARGYVLTTTSVDC